MKNSKPLLRHAFILDVLCLLLSFALLFLGFNDKIPYWALVLGALVALVTLVASILLFVKARKIDREESRRIEREILESATHEDAVDKAIENGDLEDNQDDYKNDDEQ